MTKYELHDYKCFRSIMGERAKDALRSTKIKSRFEELEAQGNVRLRSEYEQDNYFDVYGEPDSPKERKQIERLIELNGCFVVFAEHKCPCCEQWKTDDSIGMIIENDPTNPFKNSYAIELMSSAIAAYEKGANHD